MSNKIYLDKKVCIHFYIMMMVAFYIIYFLILASFVYFIWQERLTYISLFDTQTMMQAHDTKNWSSYMALLESVARETFYFLVKVVVIKLVIKAFKNIPLPSRWLKKWDDEKQVEHLLGREMCHHLRFNRYLVLKDFYALHRSCQAESQLLERIGKDENLSPLFEKYDTHYAKDQVKS